MSLKSDVELVWVCQNYLGFSEDLTAEALGNLKLIEDELVRIAKSRKIRLMFFSLGTPAPDAERHYLGIYNLQDQQIPLPQGHRSLSGYSTKEESLLAATDLLRKLRNSNASTTS